MIHPKIISIIESCVNVLQLDTCEKWCDYLMPKEDYSEALKLIQHRKEQIQIVAVKSGREFAEGVHNSENLKIE